jgi:hypothetical protein
VRTDVLETEIILSEHIPEHLPIAGHKRSFCTWEFPMHATIVIKSAI